uniref:Phosphoribosylformylglycinamidine synthase n=1 Tax=Lygus hesperus TaxID=30085 RepID=A0A0A9YQP1_LYGHE
MGPWIGLLLIVVIYSPRCSESGHDGRVLTKNEFPELAVVNRDGGFVPIQNTTKLCMGVIYGSTTIVSSAGCAWQVLKRRSKDITVRTNQNMFAQTEEVMTYPTMDLTFSAPSVKQGFNFSFAIFRLQMPGIMVEPYEGLGNVTVSNSTGIRAANWMSDPIQVEYIVGKTVTGVVVTPDRRVVAMTLMLRIKCKEEWEEYTVTDPQQEILLDNAICAVQAKDGTYHNDNFERVPPGYVCNDDYGAPFIYEGQVVGVLVRAFCEFEGPSAPKVAVFLTLLPVDDINAVTATTASGGSGAVTQSGVTNPATRDDGGREEDSTTVTWFTNPTPTNTPTGASGGHCFRSNIHYASVVLTAGLLITKLPSQ